MSFWYLRCPVPETEAELASYIVARALETAVELEEAPTPSPDEARESWLIIRTEAPLSRDALEKLRSCYALLELSPPSFEQIYEADDGWRESWRDAFTPTAICAEVSVRPPWAAPSQLAPLELIIDPGLAFGTGTHPTTQGAMTLLADALSEAPAGAVLDFGAGSAILAIAAARWGHHVDAVEIDAVALKNAAENLRLNGVEELVMLHCGGEVPKKNFTLTVANIIAPILIENAEALLASAPRLILSGILEEQLPSVLEAYRGAHCLTQWSGEGGWVALSLERIDR